MYWQINRRRFVCGLFVYFKGDEKLADNNTEDVSVIVSGTAAIQTGESQGYGKWILIDGSGDFSIDKNITATIWIIGGGCDGESGYWIGENGEHCTATRDQPAALEDGEPNKGIAYSGGESGKGGDGGYVLVMYNIKIPANINLSAIIAPKNDKTGTSLNIEGVVYQCNQSGSFCRLGGAGGIVPNAIGNEDMQDQTYGAVKQSYVTREKGGKDGVATPCFINTINGSTNFVGSSGSGGAACGGGADATPVGSAGQGAGNGEAHRSPGTDAIGYGCGGGGGATCGNIKARSGRMGGYGKGGCIIIAYTIEPEPEKTLVVQKHYKRVCNTNKTCNTDYYSSSSYQNCCGTNNFDNCKNECNSNNFRYTDTIFLKKKQ